MVPRREDNTDEDSFNLILDQLEKAFRRGHYQEVVDKGSLYIKQSPQAFLFWSLLGRANLKLDKPLSAESCFDVAFCHCSNNFK